MPTKPNGLPAGHAFVNVSSATEAERAIKELSGQIVLNRKVIIQLAKPAAASPTEPAIEAMVHEDKTKSDIADASKASEAERAIEELMMPRSQSNSSRSTISTSLISRRPGWLSLFRRFPRQHWRVLVRRDWP